MAATIVELRSTLYTSSEILGLTAYGEAQNQPVEGQIAILNVIRNRALFRASLLRTIALEDHQFSCWWDGSKNSKQLYELAQALKQQGAVEDEILKQCLGLASLCVTGTLLDNTFDSTFYVEVALFNTNPPTWAKGQMPNCRIGRHVFFKNIPPYARLTAPPHD